MTSKLSPGMKNVLSAIVEQTVKTRGKNAGEVKNRIRAYEVYYANTVYALKRRGLIDVKYGTIFGDGYAATKAGFEAYKNGELK